MKPSKVFQKEFLTVFLCLLGYSLSSAALKKVRGYRVNIYHRNDLPNTFRQRILKGAYSPTVAPTTVAPAVFDMAAAKEKEKEEEGEEQDLAEGLAEALENKDATKEQVISDTPSLSPNVEITDSPTTSPALSTDTDSPTMPPTTPATTDILLANEITVEPSTVASPALPTASPTRFNSIELEAPTQPGLSTIDNATEVPLLYNVRLEPFFQIVSLSKGDFNEEDYMEVLAGYIEYYMMQSFPKFQSIAYGISTFSKLTALPNTAARSTNINTPESPIASNITVHIHLLTATFVDAPTQPDLIITEYMEMLLENAKLFQEYIDMQSNLDAQIHSVSVDFEETVQPTNVQDATTQNSSDTGDNYSDAATTDEISPATEEKAANIGMIVGITVGCFVALLLIILMYGMRSNK
jgi:hypothetical protein